MGENKKAADKEIEVKEFVSRGTGTNLKKKAAKARQTYAKKSFGTELAELLTNKGFISLVAYAVAVIAVILISTLVCEIPVVAVCSIVVLETMLAACLHNLPIWLHGIVIIAEILCGFIFGKMIFMIVEAVLYLAAIFALRVIRQ